jgi:hypothetical protein
VRVSVVVPPFNRLALLAETLTHLSAQKSPLNRQRFAQRRDLRAIV